jgi:anti-anti-sigma factor
MHRECAIKIYQVGDTVTIEVLGDLRASTESDMKAKFREACSYNPAKILLKFDSANQISSAGITIITRLVMASQGKGFEILITGVSKHFQKILELVGLTRYITIVESEG